MILKNQSGRISHYAFYLTATAVFIIGGFFVNTQYGKYFKKVESSLSAQVAGADSIKQVEPAPVVRKVTLLAVGDIMMHQAQLDATYNKKNGKYDFSSFFVNIKPYLNNADIVYANLETPIAGKELKYSGYPRFNAPAEILTELKNNYFTHVSLANNHALDRGVVGLTNTIKNVENSGLIGLGARIQPDTKIALSGTSSLPNGIVSPISNYQITEKNGLKFGFVSYTYDTNGLTLPKSKSGMLSYINKEQIVRDINDLKKQNVDVIVTALHFGVEYKLQENASQRELAQLACNSGANIVLGDHPHVLEPITFLKSTNGEKCLVIYSLGNFVSGMTNPYTDLGGILKLEITKEINPSRVNGSSTLSITPDFMGTWVKRGSDKNGNKYYTVLPLDADKIPVSINVSKREQDNLEKYRIFVNTKIKAW
ncbi:MAG: CapA family protein [bacterium]